MEHMLLSTVLRLENKVCLERTYEMTLLLQTKCCLGQSLSRRDATTGMPILNKYFSLLDTCYVVEVAQLYKYKPPVHFPSTVGKCDTSQRNFYPLSLDLKSRFVGLKGFIYIALYLANTVYHTQLG